MSVVLKNDAIFPRSPAISIFNQIWKNHTQISYLIKVQLWATRQLDLTQLNAIDALYLASINAPLWSRSFAISFWPYIAASWSGFRKSSGLYSTPLVKNSFTILT